jgi:hypothetical protein
MPGFINSRSEISSHCGHGTDYVQLEKTLVKLAETTKAPGYMPLSELINLPNANQQRPLAIACQANLKNTVALLLSYGAIPAPSDIKDTSNETIKELLMATLRTRQQEATEQKQLPRLR